MGGETNARTGSISDRMTTVWVIVGYLLLLIALGFISSRFFRKTSSDYFVASRSIGPFLLLMSVFGTTMTAFALVGSTGEAFEKGIGVYGQLASWSGLVHSAVFFLVGIKLWAIGKRHNFVTQIQYFRSRFQSDSLGYLLFPILVGLVIPYLLIGLLGAGAVLSGVTRGMFPDTFTATAGAIPAWLTSLVLCGVVLFYVFLGGLRGAAWANTFQTLVFMATGILAFWLIANKLGGLRAATAAVEQNASILLAREGLISRTKFFTYALVPLSVGMFPHVFQHWLTARSAKTFRLTVIAHPLFIMLVWVPCILIGIWAAGAGVKAPNGNANAILGIMVSQLGSPFLTGLLTAGILAAIMSSLDSQFVCLGTLFTQDIVLHRCGPNRFTDQQKIWIGRSFIVLIVLITFLFSLAEPRHVFKLGVWCFSGFAGLFPLVFAALYWRRVTRAGAFACVGATALTWLAFFKASGFGMEPVSLFGIEPIVHVVALSTFSLITVSLLSEPPAPQIVDQFFPINSKPVQSPSTSRTARHLRTPTAM